jgi:hypothetical protein
MALSFIAPARTCDQRFLDRHAHTAHTQPTVIVGPVSTVLGISQGCNPSTVCPSDRSTPHPCVAAASHLIHTRPPDVHVACLANPKSLSNTYFSLDLRRPRRRSHRALAITRSGAGLDIPGFGRSRSDMSDQEYDAPAARNARGGSRPRAGPFLHATTSSANVSGADLNFQILTTLHGHAALSSRTKTFLVTSTSSSCSSAFNFVGFSHAAHSLALSLPRLNLPSIMLKKLTGWKCMIMIVTRLKTSFITAFKISGSRSLIP